MKKLNLICIVSFLSTSLGTIIFFGMQEIIESNNDIKKLIITIEALKKEAAMKAHTTISTPPLVSDETVLIITNLVFAAALLLFFFYFRPFSGDSGDTKTFTNLTDTTDIKLDALREVVASSNNSQLNSLSKMIVNGNNTQLTAIQDIVANGTTTNLAAVQDVLANSICNKLSVVQCVASISLTANNRTHLDSIKDLLIEYTKVLSALILQNSNRELENNNAIIAAINTSKIETINAINQSNESIGLTIAEVPSIVSTFFS